MKQEFLLCASIECPLNKACRRHDNFMRQILTPIERNNKRYFVPPPLVWIDQPDLMECEEFWPIDSKAKVAYKAYTGG